jgi:hypothetical protein
VNAVVDGPRPFSIPRGSPLASGWRRQVADLLERHGISEVLDVLAAYAELRCRHEPDDCSGAAEAAAGGWYRLRHPAQRRIDAIEVRRGPGRPRQDEWERLADEYAQGSI